uniref:Sec20 C-terminal domain-containing protein n=1 Tax=Eutreptiella gymnastica TaxID=73025 RepID=A0A7S4LMC6_9EUGL
MEYKIQQQLDELLNLEIEVQKCTVVIKQGLLSPQALVQTCTTINTKLNELSTKMRELEMDMEGFDSHSKRDHDSLLKTISHHKTEIERLRTSARSATVVYNKKIAAQHYHKEKLELLGAYAGSRANKGGSKGSEVIEALQRTRGLISQQLDKTQETMKYLDEGSEKLRQTYAEYQSHRGAVASNAQLLNKLATRMMTDSVFVYFAFAVYIAVCMYILRKRLF